ncbi:hypothetical protein G5C51_36565 [Streptomyces sp. A7024]|uniref:Uncharacterized protein n=1 Tax=Streptomyces coryli TaxID=1128680 RepID=A0A6G4UAY4_9ACTN|nr:hypothetical protein [Streptomyces coryli]NGN69389.1 hypothetical protein [Streptomyces coryli]
MTLDQALVGHWTSLPYDTGAIETSDLGFLPDGRGWSVWSSMSGGLHVARFRWFCPGPGRLELHEQWHASGTWAEPEGFASVDEAEHSEGLVRTRYAIGGDGGGAVVFTTPVEFTDKYARGDRTIAPTDDPSYELLPYA